MLQAPMFDGLLFDGDALAKDMLVAPEVGVGARHLPVSIGMACFKSVCKGFYDQDESVKWTINQ